MPTAPSPVLAAPGDASPPTAPSAVLEASAGAGDPDAPEVVLEAAAGAGDPDAPELVLEATADAEPVGMMVSGVTSAWPVNGYYAASGTANGRPVFALGIYRVQWTGSEWRMVPDSGMLVYFSSTDNVATPDLVTTWTDGVGTGDPAVAPVYSVPPTAVQPVLDAGTPAVPDAVLGAAAGGTPDAPLAVVPAFTPGTPARPRGVVEPAAGWRGQVTDGGETLTDGDGGVLTDAQL